MKAKQKLKVFIITLFLAFFYHSCLLFIFFQRNIYKSTSTRVYILAGSYYYFDDDYTDNNGNTLKDINHSFNAGVGLAVKYFYKRIIFSIDLGYKFFEDNKIITKNQDPPYPEVYRVTKIGAGIGFGFMF